MLLQIRNKSNNLISLGKDIYIKSKDTTLLDTDLITTSVIDRINNCKYLNLIAVKEIEKQDTTLETNKLQQTEETVIDNNTKSKSTKKSKK